MQRGFRWTDALGMGAVSLVAVLGEACQGASSPVAPGPTCALGTPAPPALPRLYRALIKPPATASYAEKPICEKPHALADECEVVDDVQALLGTGFDCVDGADQALGACSGYSHGSELETLDSEAPCGASACKNVALRIRDPNGTVLHLTFYDDVSCHMGPREPGCPHTERSCYYRVASVEPE
jgi:hypothetical protein